MLNLINADLMLQRNCLDSLITATMIKFSLSSLPFSFTCYDIKPFYSFRQIDKKPWTKISFIHGFYIAYHFLFF